MQALAKVSPLCPVLSPCPRVTTLSPLSVPGHSVDPGLAGLLGQRAPRSKQPFLVTFFRASPSPVRAPRAARPLKRRPPKKTNELPHANRLPGIFGEVRGGPGTGPKDSSGDRTLRALCRTKPVVTPSTFLTPSFASCVLRTSHCPLRPCHPEAPTQPSPGSPGLFLEVSVSTRCPFLQALVALRSPWEPRGSAVVHVNVSPPH